MRRVAVAVIVIVVVVVVGAAFYGGRASINNRQASSAVTTTTTASTTTTTTVSAIAKRGSGDVLACAAFDAGMDGAYSGLSQAIQQQLIDNELLLAQHATNAMLTDRGPEYSGRTIQRASTVLSPRWRPRNHGQGVHEYGHGANNSAKQLSDRV